ncbi:hypothetical protein [Diaphorobacter caeni]|uniref:hypothetical protein n=1 Tax=Diaphorobacter caeni TaxID=2784387 RepID=UPI00188EA217|nr:hypothetical protein [Diaphorobacter caeni]MBF5006384.1 hypothetical protein [Diaphorobacter caeni]
MLVAFRQRVLGWLGGGGDRSNARPDDFRVSEPVLTYPLHMDNVGNGNLQVGQNNGSVRVVHLKQERNVTHIHVYGEQDPTEPEDEQFDYGVKATPAQREVMLMIRQLPKPMTVYKFMEEKFNTQFVLDLESEQVRIVKSFVEPIIDELNKSQRENA